MGLMKLFQRIHNKFQFSNLKLLNFFWKWSQGQISKDQNWLFSENWNYQNILQKNENWQFAEDRNYQNNLQKVGIFIIIIEFQALSDDQNYWQAF